jgi:hypothetical protein
MNTATEEISERRWWWLYAFTVLLACVHTGQSIVFFNGIPGDLADARLTNCFLEHFYQWLCGYAHLFSPSQFYPVQNTLVYGDNHFGTALIYALFRSCGASTESAFQEWLLVVIGCNTIAVLFLFHRSKVAPVIGCPLALLATSSSALILKAGHPQVLLFFPFIVALSFFLSFLRTGNVKCLGWSLLWFAYQNACYMYHGYFTIVIFGTILVIFVSLGRDQNFRKQMFQSLRTSCGFLVICISAAILLVGALYLPYATFSAGSGTRSLEELASLAPNPGAWFSASPLSAFYSKQAHYKPGANIVENTLFSGWVAWICMIAALAAAARRWRDLDVRLAGILIIAVLAVMSLMTTWWGTYGNAYLWLAHKIPSMRAFRAFTRVVYPLIVLQAVAIALFLNYFYRVTKSRFIRVLCVGVASAIAIEQLTVGQHHYLKTTSQQRSAGLAEMWQKAGGRPVLIFAPGNTNQGAEIIHTDCWQTALRLHKSTINGYSGNQPPTHAAFLSAPTVENAKALVAALRLPAESVSMVTDWPAALKSSLNIITYNPAGQITPTTSVKEIRVRPNEEISLPVVLNNANSYDIPCDSFNIYASYRLFDANDDPVNNPPSLRTPVHTIHRGESPIVSLRVQAPYEPGVYQARLSMVQEGVAWWADRGYKGSTIIMIVE